MRGCQHRWQEELTNKRQFLSYMQSLHEDISVSKEKIERSSTAFESQLSTLKAMVSTCTSLPKAQVYPVFEALSKAWEELTIEYHVLLARSRSIKAYDINTCGANASSIYIYIKKYIHTCLL